MEALSGTAGTFVPFVPRPGTPDTGQNWTCPDISAASKPLGHRTDRTTPLGVSVSVRAG